MTKIVNEELKMLMPLGLNDEQQKPWRFLLSMRRRNDLAQENPRGGLAIGVNQSERVPARYEVMNSWPIKIRRKYGR